MQHKVLPSSLALHLLLACGCCLGIAQTPASVPALIVPLVLPSVAVFDAQGNFYVAEEDRHLVRKISATGSLSTFVGTGTQGFSGDGGPALAASLDSPQGLAISSSTLYIADTRNHRVRAVDLPAQTISTIAGTGAPGSTGDGGLATAAQFVLPTALALGPDGSLYIADRGAHRIRKVDAVSHVISTVAGDGTQGFSGDGQAAISASLDSPDGLALDASGNLYIADTHNHRLRVVHARTGIISTVAGDGIQGFSGDGSTATSSQLALPRGIGVDSTGAIYVADSANNRIRRIAPDGSITTVAGNGIQSFSGEGAAATFASLDSPRSAALSSSGLPVFSDAHNERIRQISADQTIHTIAGLGVTAPGQLVLSAPSVLYYGSGQIVAELHGGLSASGSITFFSSSATDASLIGTAPLTANSAVLDTAKMSPGAYSVAATYPGDLTHPAAQSSVISLTISPLPISATPLPATILYGQPPPALAGTLVGVLPQDTSNVAVNFSSAAATLSPAGVYPITATLSGSAAPDYALTVAPAEVTVARAPAICSISVSGSTAAPGLPVTISGQVSSTTSGLPTGTLNILDGSNPIGEVHLTSAVATFTTDVLTAGNHYLTCDYSGDSNFLPASSAATSLTIASGTGTPGSDFTLSAASLTTQTVAAGASASFSFSTQAQGTPLASPIALAISGLPAGATASFNPAYLPPGGTVHTFTLTITAPVSSVVKSVPHRRDVALFALAALLLPLGIAGRRLRPRASAWVAVLCCLSSLLLAGCGARVYSHAQTGGSSQTYNLVVNATATSPSGEPCCTASLSRLSSSRR